MEEGRREEAETAVITDRQRDWAWGFRGQTSRQQTVEGRRRQKMNILKCLLRITAYQPLSTAPPHPAHLPMLVCSLALGAYIPGWR